jgi:hypothetical protein
MEMETNGICDCVDQCGNSFIVQAHTETARSACTFLQIGQKPISSLLAKEGHTPSDIKKENKTLIGGAAVQYSTIINPFGSMHWLRAKRPGVITMRAFK